MRTTTLCLPFALLVALIVSSCMPIARTPPSAAVPLTSPTASAPAATPTPADPYAWRVYWNDMNRHMDELFSVIAFELPMTAVDPAAMAQTQSLLAKIQETVEVVRTTPPPAGWEEFHALEVQAFTLIERNLTASMNQFMDEVSALDADDYNGRAAAFEAAMEAYLLQFDEEAGPIATQAYALGEGLAQEARKAVVANPTLAADLATPQIVVLPGSEVWPSVRPYGRFTDDDNSFRDVVPPYMLPLIGGDVFVVTGRTQDGTYWQIRLGAAVAWVPADEVKPYNPDAFGPGDSSIPVALGPATPTPFPIVASASVVTPTVGPAVLTGLTDQYGLPYTVRLGSKVELLALRVYTANLEEAGREQLRLEVRLRNVEMTPLHIPVKIEVYGPDAYPAEILSVGEARQPGVEFIVDTQVTNSMGDVDRYDVLIGE